MWEHPGTRDPGHPEGFPWFIVVVLPLRVASVVVEAVKGMCEGELRVVQVTFGAVVVVCSPLGFAPFEGVTLHKSCAIFLPELLPDFKVCA